MSRDFVLRPEFAGSIRWSRRGSCGNPGCSDPECGCALCKLPIGVPDDDPRWESHQREFCGRDDCELCRDQVPTELFRGKGRAMEAARFHWECFRKVTWFPARRAAG